MKPLLDTARYIYNRYRLGTSAIRVLPDFIIIGAQKGGTTSLYNYLIEHPHIASARMKEVHYFDRNFTKGVSWYKAHFPTLFQKYYSQNIRRQKFITGEGSPEYLFFRHPPKLAAKILPHAKIIVMLRNPVDRAYSQYQHNVGWGFEKLSSFQEAIASEEERTREGRERSAVDEYYHDRDYQRAAYLARGMYAVQLERWLDLFPREQFLIIRSEDFYIDPEEVYKETLAFLQVPILIPRNLQKGYKTYNKSKEIKSKMDGAMREYLVEYFKPHNAQLYTLLGRDFGWDR
ncbi:MAG: sulfotransferase domain-containing protein [Chloroflexota bacterium]|nr:sulfotransferase domain-containing protein [Chloroflexota bacterium]